MEPIDGSTKKKCYFVDHHMFMTAFDDVNNIAQVNVLRLFQAPLLAKQLLLLE